jgi:hypothetical protein
LLIGGRNQHLFVSALDPLAARPRPLQILKIRGLFPEVFDRESHSDQSRGAIPSPRAPEAGLNPNIFVESRSPQALLALAEAGHGVAIAPSVLPTHRCRLRVARIMHRRRPLREPWPRSGTNAARFRPTPRVFVRPPLRTCARYFRSRNRLSGSAAALQSRELCDGHDDPDGSSVLRRAEGPPLALKGHRRHLIKCLLLGAVQTPSFHNIRSAHAMSAVEGRADIVRARRHVCF